MRRTVVLVVLLSGLLLGLPGSPGVHAAPGGPEIVTVTGFGGDESATALARQPDGKLVVGGTTRDGGFLLTRFSTEGALDRTFGIDGRVEAPPVAVTDVVAVLVVSGRIVVAATGAGPRMVLLGFGLDGRVDPGFGTGGALVIDAAGGASTIGAELDGNRIVAAGRPSVSTGVPVARVTADGRMDPTFGVGGVATIADRRLHADHLAVDQGRPVVVGEVGVDDGFFETDVVVWRLTVTGSPDPTFGAGGRTQTDLGAVEAPSAVAAAPGGGVYVAAVSYTQDVKFGVHDFQTILLRYNDLGILDGRFGRGGVSRLGMRIGVNDLAIDGAARPVVVAAASDFLGVGRYLPDGRLDPAYGCGGFARIRPAPTDAASGAALLADADGSVVAVGRHRRQFAFNGDILFARLAGDDDRRPCPPAYWMVGSDGGVFSFGLTDFHGSTGDIRLNRPITGMAPTPAGVGYWLVATDGGIFAFGDALFFGSTGSLRLRQPVVGMAPSPTGLGYWLVAADGGIFAFGDAPFLGSTGGLPLSRPVVGMAATPTGRGYWLVASDGGIFAFGDARFFGSTGALRLQQPIVGMAPTPSGRGYWLVAADGGVFSFGDAPYFGSTGGRPLSAPIVAITASPTGAGYRLSGRDGAVYGFGDAGTAGDLRGLRLQAPIVGATAP